MKTRGNKKEKKEEEKEEGEKEGRWIDRVTGSRRRREKARNVKMSKIIVLMIVIGHYFRVDHFWSFLFHVAVEGKKGGERRERERKVPRAATEFWRREEEEDKIILESRWYSVLNITCSPLPPHHQFVLSFSLILSFFLIQGLIHC